mgnify:CR=1 FL=1
MRIKVILASILLTLIPFASSYAAISYDGINPIADNIVFVGDSYCMGANLDSPDEGWAEITARYFGSQKYIRSCKGGTGFSATSSDESFINLVEHAAEQSEDPNAIEWVVIMGGYNDYRVDDDTLLSDGAQMILRAKELFPQATILVGMNAWDSIRADRQEQLDRVLLDVRAIVQSTGVTYVDHIEEVLYNHPEFFTSDGVHPNSNGQSRLAECLATFISNIVSERAKADAEVQTAEKVNAYGNITLWLVLGTGIIIYLIYGIRHILAEKKTAK